MKNLVMWTVCTLILAAVFHVAGLWLLPRLITQIAVNRILTGRSLVFNEMNYGDIRSAGKDTVPMENADSKTTFAVFDVTDKPVRIKCVVPPTDNYWSVSLYAWNTDNFYVVNDRTAKEKAFDLVLVKPGSKYQSVGKEEILTVPTNKGVMLIRMLVNDRNDKDEVARLGEYQKQTVMETIETAAY